MNDGLPDVAVGGHRGAVSCGRWSIRLIVRQTWDRLAEICGQYLGKGQLVAIEGRIQTRQWEDDHKQRHWKTEIVAAQVEMLSGRRKRDYAQESAAESLVAQATRFGVEPADGDSDAIAADVAVDTDDETTDETEAVAA